jgi:hypothetical protein
MVGTLPQDQRADTYRGVVVLFGLPLVRETACAGPDVAVGMS